MTRLLLVCFSILACAEITLAQTSPPSAGAARLTPPVGAIQQPADAGQAAVAPAAPQPPEWVAQLSAAEIQWVDDVLRFWEARSEKIKTFECRFRRWDYDGGFVDADGRQPRTFSEGTIKYGQPDKGLYRIEKLVSISPGQPGEKRQEIVQNPELGEHWICDGDNVYSFEANKKQVTKTPLPPEMRGKAIADGPLPFLFGAKAETIKARYWVRTFAPLPNEDPKAKKYRLEAVPKSRQDAQNFKMVRIWLDEADYLPDQLQIFAPNYDPPRNEALQTYVFFGRTTKDAANIADMVKNGLDPLKLFHRDFIEVKPPSGWKLVIQNPNGGAAGPPPAANVPPRPLSPVNR